MNEAIQRLIRQTGAQATLLERVRPVGFDGEFLVVDVGDADARRLLISLDAAGHAILHSAMSRREPRRLLSPYEQLIAVAALLAPRRDRILLLGLGGGAFWRHLRRLHPESDVTVVEKFPEVVAIARQWFGVAGGRIIEADAAAYVAECRDRFELIVADLYEAAGPARLPPAFWQHCHGRLGDDGALIVNWADFAGNDQGRAAAESVAGLFADTRFLIASTRENNCVQLSARAPLPPAEEIRRGIIGPPALGGRRVALDNVLVSPDWPALPQA